MSRSLERLIVVGILAEIVFTAFAFGGTTQWAAATFQAGAAALILIWGIKCAVDQRIAANLPVTTFPLVIFLLFALVQALAFTNSAGQRKSLSLDVEATRSAVAILFSLLVLFYLSANYLNTRKRLRLFARFLALYGIALAVFAIIQRFTCDACIYWTQQTAGRPFGSFPNRNHFAGYMELLMPVPLAMLSVRRERNWSPIYALAAALTLGAGLLSFSRAGALSLVAEMVFILVVSKVAQHLRGKHEAGPSAIRPARWLTPAAVMAVILLIAAGVAWNGPGSLTKRISQRIGSFASTESGRPDGREGIWRDTATLIKAHPFFGTGLGSFPTAFPLYDRSSGSLAIGAAHNDYLQIAADTGIAGSVVGLWFLIAVVRTIARAIVSPDPFLRRLALGCSGGIFGLMVHSFFDFNLQIISNALLFLVLVAIVSHLSSVVTARRSVPVPPVSK